MNLSTEMVHVSHEGPDFKCHKGEFGKGEEYFALQGKTILVLGGSDPQTIITAIDIASR